MKPIKHIAVAIERTSEYGRRFLQGVADFFDGQDDWQLDLLNPSQITSENVNDYDGWICRITNRRTLRLLHATGKPVVDAICLNPFQGFSTIRTDHTAIGTLAAEHFLAHRFSSFGFCGYRHVTFSDLRRNAFVRHLVTKGFRPNIYRPSYRTNNAQPSPLLHRNLTEGPLGEADDADSLTAWLKRLKKPVAVFCADDFRAADVVRLCKRSCLDVPGKVAVLGVDNDPVYCMFSSPRISSIDPDASALGLAAAEMLRQQLSSRKPIRPRSRTIPPKGVVVRASTDSYPNAPDWFADAISFIEGEIRTGLSASDVFRRAGYSRTLVERAFRKVLGKTVQAQIADVRTETAKRLLLTTTLPVKDIAAQTGYRSIEYFTRTFKSAVGQPPAAFRHDQTAGLKCLSIQLH